MKSKEPGLNKRNRRRKEVDQTIKNAPREIPVSIVEQSLHTQGVNALQRTQSVSSVGKRDIMAIKEVQEYTEWINSIVPVKKPNGSLRLCLDPKDLNKAVKGNQWYNRTVDVSCQSWQTRSTSAYSTPSQAIGTFHWTRRGVC